MWSAALDRQLWCPSTILYSIASITHDHHTDIYPLSFNKHLIYINHNFKPYTGARLSEEEEEALKEAKFDEIDEELDDESEDEEDILDQEARAQANLSEEDKKALAGNLDDMEDEDD